MEHLHQVGGVGVQFGLRADGVLVDAEPDGLEGVEPAAKKAVKFGREVGLVPDAVIGLLVERDPPGRAVDVPLPVGPVPLAPFAVPGLVADQGRLWLLDRPTSRFGDDGGVVGFHDGPPVHERLGDTQEVGRINALTSGRDVERVVERTCHKELSQLTSTDPKAHRRPRRVRRRDTGHRDRL